MKITKLEMPEPMPARKRVAAYARVSCGKDEMLHSLAAQVSAYSELIQSRQDWDFAGVYADADETGTRDDRPEFKRLLADCMAGLIDMVVTKAISRFARNTVTLLETVRALKERGIDIYFEKQNIHTMSADGELMLTILASYAQEESRSASENQKWRIRREFREGRITNNFLIYGYDFKGGQFIEIPEEAAVVRMIFADYLSGMGKNAITRKLVRLGVPTKTGGKWAEKTVGGILSNEKYAGDLCLQKGYVSDHISKSYKRNDGQLPKFYVEGNHDGIIDRDTFEAAQAEMARRSARIPQAKHPQDDELKGIIRCGRCGAMFQRKVHGSPKYAKVVWACATYTHRGKSECAAKRISDDILKAKCAEALGISEYDAGKLAVGISGITIPDDGVLVFSLKDGTERTLAWENPSRRESWTEEMKQAARVKALKGGGRNG
jgi:DNA invertase Pin-like site-specific DNA recombinase